MFNRKRNEQHASSGETSLIARGTVIRGDVRFCGALHLDGRVEGTIVAETEDSVFTLSEHGQVEGEIRVSHAMINGRISGDVHVSAKLELAALACIEGNLYYHTLEMAAGAQINGRINRCVNEADTELPRELAAPHVADEAASS